ncbi:MAG: undecaprenyl-diphosphate phosphatase [Gammaproteobacteria bacterium]|nr:MAG: undecaprenyl-diphosphate phosphatase [Gammaproteobacteria bacterium]
MDITQAIILALVQGLTEFLPVSSSAHLILAPLVAGWSDQGLAFDVAVHVGTLSAVIFYFRCDLLALSRGWIRSCTNRSLDPDGKLAWALLIATIPVAFFGYLLHDLVETTLRSPLVIASTTIGFGALLWFADTIAKRIQSEKQLGWREIIIIGFAQALALVPGTSRSGITMTAGLLLGMERTACVRFSFLLSIPVIALAGGYETVKLLSQNIAVDWQLMATGVLLSASAAWLTVFLFLKFIERMGMLPFVIYRFALGLLLFYLFL